MRTSFQRMSLWTRIKFVFGFYSVSDMMENGKEKKELEQLISGAVGELNDHLDKYRDNPDVVKLVMYTAALQMRIARFNIVEAGYPDLIINSVFKDQP